MDDTALDVFALLGKLSGDAVFAERYRIRANEAFLDKTPAREERFVKLYLEAENELFKRGKAGMTQERLRAQTAELLKDGHHPALRLLLLPPQVQLLALASALIAAYAERSRVFFGRHVSERVLAHALDETPWQGLRVDLDHGIAYQPERMRTSAECAEIVSVLFNRWYEQLHVTFGHKASRTVFEMAYLDVEKEFGFLEATKSLLGLTPKTVLWAEKVKRLHELEEETTLQARGLRTADEDLRRQASHLQATVQELQETRQQLEATARARSEFIEVVSHQFRTPLSSIRWSAEVLGDAAGEKRFDPELKEAVETVRQRSVYLIETLDRVFAALDIETGKVVLDAKPAFLWELVQDVHDWYEKDLARHGLKWKFERAKTQLKEIPLDKAKIAFVLKILLSNAIMYGKDNGTITARVRDEAIDGKPHQVCSITDEGIGATKEDLDRVFEKFYRSQAAVLRSPDGTGLGMFIVQHFVEANGGKAWAESPGPDKGFTAHFALPVK